jgi:hypothetical protein
MQILSTCNSQRANYCNKKNNFYADVCKTLVATGVQKNAIGNESSKHIFGKILQPYERMLMILVCISRKIILVMLVYVCQHADDIGDDCMSAHRGYW